MRNNFPILGTNRGDENKRTCEHYSACENWITLWEDEINGQEQCPVCGATAYWTIDTEPSVEVT